MAIQGTFTADFSSFVTAVEKADVSLRTFEQNAGKVETSLTRLTDSLSGVKIVQQATLAAEAVERIGGASKLTDAELQRVASTAREAVAKLTAMGQDVPPQIAKLAAEFHEVDTSAGSAGTSFLKFVGGFVTAQAIWDGAKAALRGVIEGLKEVGEIALTGAAVADVEQNFQRLTTQAGLLGAQLLGTLREGTHGTITDFELMKTVNQDLAAGMQLTDKEFGTLAKGAFALAQATGGDVKTALDTMNDAMLTGRTRSLALLTGKIDQTKAEKDYAATLGVTADHLSEDGKLQASRIAILKATGEATDRLGIQMDGLDERVGQSQTTWANFKLELGKVIAQSPVLETAMTQMQSALINAFGGNQQQLIAAIAREIDAVAIAVVGLAIKAVEAGGFILEEWYAVKKVYGDLAQIIDGVTLATLYLGKAQMALPNAIGLGTDAYQRNDAAIQSLLVAMQKRGAQLQADDAAQAGVSDRVKQLTAALDDVRGKMDAARDSAATYTEGQKGVAAAEDGASAAARRHGDVLAQTDAERKAAQKITEQSIIETIALDERATALRIAHGGTALQAQLASIEAWFNSEVAKLKASDQNWGAHYQALAALAAEQKRGALVDWQFIADHSRTHLEEMAARAQATYEAMIAASGEFSNDAIQHQRAVAEEARNQARNWRDAWSSEIQKTEPVIWTWRSIFGQALVEIGAEADKARKKVTGVSDAAQAAQKFKTLGGEFLTKEEIALRQSQGGQFLVPEIDVSHETDRHNAEARLAFLEEEYKRFPGRRAGGYGETGINKDDATGWTMMLREQIEYAALKKALGRASGGPVSANMPYMVGERGPELFVPKSAGTIVPNGAGGITLNIAVDARESFYDSPAGVQRMVDKISDGLIKRLRSQGVQL